MVAVQAWVYCIPRWISTGIIFSCLMRLWYRKHSFNSGRLDASYSSFLPWSRYWNYNSESNQFSRSSDLTISPRHCYFLKTLSEIWGNRNSSRVLTAHWEISSFQWCCFNLETFLCVCFHKCYIKPTAERLSWIFSIKYNKSINRKRNPKHTNRRSRRKSNKSIRSKHKKSSITSTTKRHEHNGIWPSIQNRLQNSSNR